MKIELTQIKTFLTLCFKVLFYQLFFLMIYYEIYS